MRLHEEGFTVTRAPKLGVHVAPAPVPAWFVEWLDQDSALVLQVAHEKHPEVRWGNRALLLRELDQREHPDAGGGVGTVELRGGDYCK